MQLDDILFDYDEWKKKEPSVAQKITSMIARPAEWLINPIIDKIHPILEETLKKSNAKIADIIHTTADELENPLEMKEEDFLKWMETQDESVDRWITGGIASISAEGTASGFIGLAGLLTEIPISFGTILFFANKIAFQYYLNITDEQTNLEVLKAISAGSAASLESKKDCISGFESTSSTLHKDTWKSLTKSTEGLHHSVFIA
ncbi:MAG: EcsC family protein, partial [Leptospiraceae bacterium]|nr:EcsC family protein [Leptospiraceae bacterium]